MDEPLLRLLVCPQDGAALHYDPSRSQLCCRSCKVAYAIREGVPILVADQARPLTIDEIDGLESV